MMIKLLKAGEKVHYIVCNGFTDKKPLLLLQTILMFEQDEELKQYKNNVHFSLVENYGKSLSGDLQKLSEEVAKFPEHHTFVDEFIIKLNKVDDVKVEQMMSKGCLPKKNSIWRDIVPTRGEGVKNCLKMSLLKIHFFLKTIFREGGGQIIILFVLSVKISLHT